MNIIGGAMKLVGGVAGIPAIGWKIATCAAGAATLGLLVFLGAQMMENRHLTKENAKLDTQINAPGVGYVAQIAQATTNVAQLTTGIAHQKQVMQTQAAEDAAKLAAITAQLAAVQKANVTLQAASARISAKPPQGATLEARVLDVDAKLLETLQ